MPGLGGTPEDVAFWNAKAGHTGQLLRSTIASSAARPETRDAAIVRAVIQ
jgi:hypothetical protein